MDKNGVIQQTKKALCILEEYALNGLPEPYTTFEEAISDWYYKLPWIEQESRCSFDFLASDSDASRIANLILEAFNYDLMKQWQTCSYQMDSKRSCLFDS
jgi:hypothetical protein